MQALIEDNILKLFFFDVGLLGYLLEMSYKDQLAQKVSYKGYIAEFFVQNELRVNVAYPTYSWEFARGEIELLLQCENGAIVPVEVKGGARTRAKRLQSYIDRYSPSKTIKLIGSVGGNNPNNTRIVWPLYYAKFLGSI